MKADRITKIIQQLMVLVTAALLTACAGEQYRKDEAWKEQRSTELTNKGYSIADARKIAGDEDREATKAAWAAIMPGTGPADVKTPTLDSRGTPGGPPQPCHPQVCHPHVCHTVSHCR